MCCHKCLKYRSYKVLCPNYTNILVLGSINYRLVLLWFYCQFRLRITKAQGKAHTPKVARIQRLPPGGRLFVSLIIIQTGRENNLSADICLYYDVTTKTLQSLPRVILSEVPPEIPSPMLTLRVRLRFAPLRMTAGGTQSKSVGQTACRWISRKLFI